MCSLGTFQVPLKSIWLRPLLQAMQAVAASRISLIRPKVQTAQARHQHEAHHMKCEGLSIQIKVRNFFWVSFLAEQKLDVVKEYNIIYIGLCWKELIQFKDGFGICWWWKLPNLGSRSRGFENSYFYFIILLLLVKCLILIENMIFLLVIFREYCGNT